MESVVWVQGLVENQFGNSKAERHQGRVANGAILSCSGLVNLAIFEGCGEVFFSELEL